MPVRFADVGVDDRSPGPKRRDAGTERRLRAARTTGLFVFGGERRRPHDDELAAVGGADPRPAGRERLFGSRPGSAPASWPSTIARDEHVGDAADALEVHEPARPVFGHRDATEARRCPRSVRRSSCAGRITARACGHQRPSSKAPASASAIAALTSWLQAGSRWRPGSMPMPLHELRVVHRAGRLVEGAAEVLGLDDRLGAREAALVAVAVDGHVLQRFREGIGRQRHRVGLSLARVAGRRLRSHPRSRPPPSRLRW